MRTSTKQKKAQFIFFFRSWFSSLERGFSSGSHSGEAKYTQYLYTYTYIKIFISYINIWVSVIFIFRQVGLGRISEISGNGQQGTPDYPAGYPASGKKNQIWHNPNAKFVHHSQNKVLYSSIFMNYYL